MPPSRLRPSSPRRRRTCCASLRCCEVRSVPRVVSPPLRRDCSASCATRSLASRPMSSRAPKLATSFGAREDMGLLAKERVAQLAEQSLRSGGETTLGTLLTSQHRKLAQHVLLRRGELGRSLDGGMDQEIAASGAP